MFDHFFKPQSRLQVVFASVVSLLICNLTYFLGLRLLNKLIKADKQDCSNVRPLCGWELGIAGGEVST